MVTLKATFSDPHAEGSGALGPDGIAGTGDEGYGNDYVDGTITLNGRTHTRRKWFRIQFFSTNSKCWNHKRSSIKIQTFKASSQ